MQIAKLVFNMFLYCMLKNGPWSIFFANSKFGLWSVSLHSAVKHGEEKDQGFWSTVFANSNFGLWSVSLQGFVQQVEEYDQSFWSIVFANSNFGLRSLSLHSVVQHGEETDQGFWSIVYVQITKLVFDLFLYYMLKDGPWSIVFADSKFGLRSVSLQSVEQQVEECDQGFWSIDFVNRSFCKALF